jgi:undecaprenyl-diphosphatase
LKSTDEALLRFMRTTGHSPGAEQAVRRFSVLGEHGGIWLAIGLLGAACDRARRPRWLHATGAVAGTYLLNTTIKLLVRRRRPSLPGLPPLASTPTQLSFPSAHTATAFAGALGYSRLGVPAAPLYGLALATAISRPYLGLHYPSDVLAGALLGMGVAAAAAQESRR